MRKPHAGGGWTSAEAAPPAEDGWHVLVADVDGDGAPEVMERLDTDDEEAAG